MADLGSAHWAPRAGVEIAVRRAGMLAAARRFFSDQQILEVDVPALSAAAVSDPNIDSIGARTSLSSQPAYLHTSPEYAMKRLLAAGFPDIGFIGRVFRDGEAGRHHQPEFTMIEWYRLGFGLNEMIRDTEELLQRLLDGRHLKRAPRHLSYRDAFLDTLAIDPFGADASTLAAACDADDDLKALLGDDTDAWLDLLLATRVASRFAGDGLTVIHHYPASQAALARLSPGSPATADRFEVFLGAIELANGYVELTDADEQRTRFERDQAIRLAGGRPRTPIDNRLLAAIAAGLPECAGVAIGLDRLLMINSGADDIRDVYHFCWEECE